VYALGHPGGSCSYRKASAASAREKVIPPDCKLGREKYLDNAVVQDHRAIRRREAAR
jgi:hypothetical protein